MTYKLLLSASVSGLAILLAPAAIAQTMPASPLVTTASQTSDAAPDVAQDIIVTGFRASLQSAIQEKRNAPVILDSISAEDIGKFPETNLAESLQRITGVQITRSNGEGQNISIRGLSPDLNQINFNGRTLPSPTGSRTFDFTILSSDFVSGLDVYKSPTAEMEEGGLAGTVNVRTLQPKDVKGPKLTATAEGIYDGNAKATTPHISILGADRFLDGKLSVVAGFDYSKRKLLTTAYQAFGLQPFKETDTNIDYNNNGRIDQNGPAYLLNNAANYVADFGTRERISGTLAVGYDVTDNLNIWANGLYSRFTNDIKTALEANRFVNIVPASNAVVSSVIGANNILTYFDANGVDNRNNGRPDYYRDTLGSYAIGGTWKAGEWQIDAEGSIGKAKRVETTVSLETIARESVSIDLRPDPGGPAQITYMRGYNPLDPTIWNAFGLNGEYQQPTTDKTRSARIDVSRKFDGSFIRSIKVGAQIGHREFDVVAQDLNISAQQLAPVLGLTYNPTIEASGGGTFSAAKYMKLYNFPNMLGDYSGPVSVPTTFLSSDPSLVFAQVPLSKLASMFPLYEDLANTYSIRENTLAGYAMANFASGDNRLTGNVGVRVVRTQQTAAGYSPDLSQIQFSQQGAQTILPSVTPVSFTRTYTNALPSLNAVYKLTDTLDLRFAAARVMSRPTLSVLAPNTTVNANVGTITRGNPNVSPFFSNQADLSLEWYIRGGGLLSVDGFYKHVTGFIVSTTTPLTLTVQNQGGGTTNLNFNVVQPQNGSPVNIKGVEVGYQQPLSFLPSPFNGLGVIANFTYVDADKIVAIAGQAPVPLPGTSKYSYNLVGYYEKGPVSVRLSYNYRSKFVVDNYSYFLDGNYTKAYGQFDLSSSLKINDHISASFDIVNLTNAPIVNVDIYGINRGYEDDGRRFTLGVHFKF